MYALAGVFGALLGSTAGKAFAGRRLLFLFALVMLVVGTLMLRRRADADDPTAECTRDKVPRVIASSLCTGLFSGFFGIGGGFLIVPGLVASTGMPILNAVGTSLIAVAAFGMTTTLNYAVSGLVDWPLAVTVIAGGLLGRMIGASMARRLAGTRGLLTTVFAALVFLVAGYMLWRSAVSL